MYEKVKSPLTLRMLSTGQVTVHTTAKHRSAILLPRRESSNSQEITMTQRTRRHRLQVDTQLHDFIQNEALPGTGVDADAFWAGFDQLMYDLAPRNRALLEERDRMQAEIDDWHRQHPGPVTDQAAYQAFLRKIGYLQDAPANVTVRTDRIDVEFSEQAGPQLVVPITNARYALNAANARWGSLYDALYGTDAISEEDGATRGGAYNPIRGAKVIAFARRFLDDTIPLQHGSQRDAKSYSVHNGQLQVQLENGTATTLADSTLLLGYRGNPQAPEALVFRHHGLHFESQLDRNHPIGKQDT